MVRVRAVRQGPELGLPHPGRERKRPGKNLEIGTALGRDLSWERRGFPEVSPAQRSGGVIAGMVRVRAVVGIDMVRGISNCPTMRSGHIPGYSSPNPLLISFVPHSTRKGLRNDKMCEAPPS